MVGVCGNLIPWVVGSKKKCIYPPPGIFSGIALIWVNNKRTTILEWTAAQATVGPGLIISTGKFFALKNGSLMIKLEFSGKIISEDFIDVLICVLKIHQIFIERNGV